MSATFKISPHYIIVAGVDPRALVSSLRFSHPPKSHNEQPDNETRAVDVSLYVSISESSEDSSSDDEEDSPLVISIGSSGLSSHLLWGSAFVAGCFFGPSDSSSDSSSEDSSSDDELDNSSFDS